MKNLFLILLTITATYSASGQIQIPQPSPSTKIEQKVGLTDVTLEYSRPDMRDRKIFGDLVPYGKVWRLGANANTKITFSTSVTIGGSKLKAGTYAVYAIPGETSWDVMFYSDATNWGTPQEWDETKVVAKVTAEVYKMTMNIETFTIGFDNLSNSSAVLGIIWENVYVGVEFNVPTDNIVLENINDVMNGKPSANDYYAAAVYYLQESKDIKTAKEWIDKAESMSEKLAFYQLRQKSLIYAKAGDKMGAIEIAKQSLKAAQEAGNADYIKMNEDSIKEWGGM